MEQQLGTNLNDEAANRLFYVKTQFDSYQPSSPYGQRLHAALGREHARCVTHLESRVQEGPNSHTKLERLCTNLEWCARLEMSQAIPQCDRFLYYLQMLHVERLWFAYGMNLEPVFREQHGGEWEAAPYKAKWAGEFEIMLTEKHRLASLPAGVNPGDVTPNVSMLEHLSKLLGEEPDDQFFDLLNRYVRCDLEANRYIGEGAVVTAEIALRDYEMVNSRFPQRLSFMVPHFRTAIIDFLENEFGVFIKEPDDGDDGEEWNLLTEVPRLGPVPRPGRVVRVIDNQETEVVRGDQAYH